MLEETNGDRRCCYSAALVSSEYPLDAIRPIERAGLTTKDGTMRLAEGPAPPTVTVAIPAALPRGAGSQGLRRAAAFLHDDVTFNGLVLKANGRDAVTAGLASFAHDALDWRG